MRKRRRTGASSHVAFVQGLGSVQVLLEFRYEALRQEGDAVLATLARAHGQRSGLKVEILHPQLHQLAHPQATAIDHLQHQAECALQL
jgi:non-ribosomal peptide synthetase component F